MTSLATASLRSTHRWSACCLLALVACGASAADLRMGDDGPAVVVKGLGTFGISWPKLMPGDKSPIEKHVNGRTVELKYDDGAEVSVSLGDGSAVELRFRKVPPEIVTFHLTTGIGADIGDGGTWKVGHGEAKAFPKLKPPKPFLYQGNDDSFTFTDVVGHTVSLGVPAHSYQQLQDNREWGNPTFQWQVWVPYNRGWEVHKLVIGVTEPAQATTLIDRFGQSIRKDFPGKVKDEAELKADAQSDGAYYAGLKPVATDAWGGLAGSAARLGTTGSGYFRVQKVGGRWLLLDPDGDAFFHLGICSFGFIEDFTYTRERESIYAWLPPVSGDPFSPCWHPDGFWHDKAFSFLRANLLRKYGASYDLDSHMGAMVDRVRQMGFNSIGAFSGDKAFTQKRIPRVEMIWVGPELPGIRGIADPFDDATLKGMDADWAKTVTAKAGDPLIIGYFFANEQAFEDIPRGVAQLPGTHAAKRRLIKLLQDKYKDIAAFDTAWNLKAASFAALADQGLAITTPQANADMGAYDELFLETYYQAVASTFRKYDKNHLMIGHRWQPGTANSEALCRVAGKYMDVISINYYTRAADLAFMDRLHQWTGDKPQMWSEFYYTGADESNVAPAALDLRTQRKRGEAYRAFVEAGAATGYVVGTEWFTLIDQSVTGRFFQYLNGERANTGIFNVADRPYRDLVDEMATAHREIYDVWSGRQKPFVAAGAAGGRLLQAGHALGAITLDGSVTNWPGRPPERIGAERVAAGGDGKGLEAAVKVCWDEQDLYVQAVVSDPTPLAGQDAAKGDGIELFFGGEQTDQGGALRASDRRVQLGAAQGKTWNLVNGKADAAIHLVAQPAVDGKGYTLQAAIPWASLGTTAKAGQELRCDLVVNDAANGTARQLVWNGDEHDAMDRSGWGKLQLVP